MNYIYQNINSIAMITILYINVITVFIKVVVNA